MTTPAIEMDYTVLDCPDPGALAAFYSGVLGWSVARDEGDWAEIRGPGQLRLAFQLAPEFAPIAWPDSGVHAHLDLVVDEFETTERHVLSLGAELVDASDAHSTFRVYRDPAGHIFCLCIRT
ncbi:glyoxalase [Rhodococcoides trifolii]|uniref:Glyoxalase n=1 Tax=Rhodococcoides trifolii TaxID=908250 RepID=A0A917FZD8_9NOCA|nr:VOC family protein [Rhodococcus trifolii]GGG15109.1 glyoxalase [Rhodococcus trifolii]